jgi:hypothetical protein
LRVETNVSKYWSWSDDGELEIISDADDSDRHPDGLVRLRSQNTWAAPEIIDPMEPRLIIHYHSNLISQVELVRPRLDANSRSANLAS